MYQHIKCINIDICTIYNEYKTMNNSSQYEDFRNPDRATAPLVGIAYDAVMGKKGQPSHTHQRAQLIYCSAGVFHLILDDREYLVPPTTAIWIPSHMPHQAFSTKKIHYRSLYIDTAYFKKLPQSIKVIHISLLLRELIEKACHFSYNYTKNSPEMRMGLVIIDEIITADIEAYSLPVANSSKLNKIKDYIIKHLADSLSAENIAATFAISSKTLLRLCKKETGMTFEQWRQQIKLLKAIELICLGKSTTFTAQSLGYSNDSAFIYMFKGFTGKTPSEFAALSLNQ